MAVVLPELNCDCPEGYDLQPDGRCLLTETDDVIVSGTQYTVEAASSSSYGTYGAYFFEEITDKPFPIAEIQVGVSNAVTTEDNGGNDLEILDIVSTTLWKGRLSAVGVWTTVSPTPTSEWIGFTPCLEVEEEKVFYLGFASDNQLQIFLDGEEIFNSLGTANAAYKRWHLMPITLTVGIHDFKVESLNPAGPASFGFEIYDANQIELTAATTVSITDYILFSTANRVGGQFDSGEDSGNSCEVGFLLENCDGSLECIQRTYAERPPCCYSLTNCGDPTEVLNSNLDFSEYDGRVVQLEDEEGCWSVSVSDLPCIQIDEVNLASEDDYEDCIACFEAITGGSCFLLTNCDESGDELQTGVNLTPYINQIITIDGFTGCWTVTLADQYCENAIDVVVDEYFINCEACQASENCNKKSHCHEC